MSPARRWSLVMAVAMILLSALSMGSAPASAAAAGRSFSVPSLSAGSTGAAGSSATGLPSETGVPVTGAPGSVSDSVVSAVASLAATSAPATLQWASVRGVDTPTSDGAPSMSCVSWEFCIAVTSTGYARRWDGAAWSAAVLVRAGVPLVDVSCAGTTFCMAISGNGRAFTFDGNRWSSPTAFAPGRRVSMVSCGGPGHCLALDIDQNAYRFAQGSWSSSTVPHRRGAYPSSLACPSIALCVLVDTDGKARTFDGSTWSGLTTALPLRTSSTLSCPTASSCVLIGGRYLNTFESGRWTGAKSVPLAGAAATCASLRYCVTFDESLGTYSVFNGVAWTTPKQVDATVGLPSPVTTAACFQVAGGYRCVGLNHWGVSYTLTNGKGWNQGQMVTLNRAPVSVSCVTSGFCVAVDGQAGDALMYNGSSWSRVQVTREGGLRRGWQLGLVEVECATERFCVAVDTLDGTSYSYVYDGAGWSGPAPVGGEVADLSCPTVNFCMAVATQSDAYRFDGRNWSVSSSLLPSQLAVSCTGPTFCLATAKSSSLVFDGSGWSGQTSVPGAERWLVFDDVSCVTSTFCLGNDSRGYSSVFDGVGWGGVIAGTEGMGNVECMSSQMCVATSRSEYFSRAAQFDGARWTSTPIDAALRFYDVSCPAENFCMAVNRTANGVVARPRG